MLSWGAKVASPQLITDHQWDHRANIFPSITGSIISTVSISHSCLPQHSLIVTTNCWRILEAVASENIIKVIEINSTYKSRVYIECCFDVLKLVLLTLVQSVHVKWEVLSCGICGMHTLEFPSQRLIPASLHRSRKNEDCNDHEACDIKKQVFAMDPKQRERSAPQSNFILEITGFGKAAT